MAAESIAPRRVVVVGAGMVGLCTAWHLQERGVEVTVLERSGVGAGSSWGNAGWLSPGLATPLPEPRVLRYGLRSLFDSRAALYVPLRFDPELWSFLARFAAHCTQAQWTRAMASYLEINRHALEAFDELNGAGVASPTIEAPITAAFERSEQAADLRHEFDLLERAGQHIAVSELSESQVRSLAPHVAERMGYVLQLHGQRYLDPGAFVRALGASFVARGGTLRTDFDVRGVGQDSTGVTAKGVGGDVVRGDAIVIATGAWLKRLTTSFGVRVPLQAGRGYSFSLRTDEPVAAPVYFPSTRVACTPYAGGLRVGGTMEFRSPDSPISQGRVAALVNAAKPGLRHVDWDSITDVWVGGRPVTADGMPLIGVTASPRVYVAGGHGMWGITLGPVTGRLLAQQITTAVVPSALRAFSPLR